jgi:hypothetical protein
VNGARSGFSGRQAARRDPGDVRRLHGPYGKDMLLMGPLMFLMIRIALLMAGLMFFTAARALLMVPAPRELV